MSGVSHGIDRVEVTFDDEHLVANAGLLLVSTLAVRLWVGAACERHGPLVGPGRRVTPGPQSDDARSCDRGRWFPH